MTEQAPEFKQKLADAPIIPVVSLNRVEQAVPLSEALLEGGIQAIEITLRTQAGLGGIKAVAKAGLPIQLGAGTVTTLSQLQQVCEAGAQFVVSPGATVELLREAKRQEVLYLPGVVTPSEIIQAQSQGHDFLKFFPAGSFGGAAMLKHYAGVFADVTFCPTGGVAPDNMKDYLNLPNVACVGGSWLTPKEALQADDWAEITRIAKQSVQSL